MLMIGFLTAVAASQLSWVYAAEAAAQTGSEAGLRDDLPTPLEFRLKARYLARLAQFVEWPEERFKGESAPIEIAVLDPSPFGRALERELRGRRVGKRPIRLRRISKLATLGNAHVLFISSMAEQAHCQRNSLPAGKGLLVVGESKGFAQRGGGVEFAIVDNAIRFRINRHAAEQAELKLHSQLLKIAIEVIDIPDAVGGSH